MGADVGPPDEMRPFLNQCLPSFVCRMGLAGKDELHGALRNGQQTSSRSGSCSSRFGLL